MNFVPTDIDGLWVVQLRRHQDNRGSFARTFCRNAFTAQGMIRPFVQASSSVSARAGTLRGMHYQRAPHAEAKLVRCVRGAIHDVVVDLRPDSFSYMRSAAFRLAPREDISLYIPPGCAHGFQTMEPDTEVIYQMTEEHAPDHAGGFRYDDPAFGIVWPARITAISDRDQNWPPYAHPRALRGVGRTGGVTPKPQAGSTLVNDAGE